MALFDDEPLKKPKIHEIGQDLSLLSVGELNERIAILRAEIERLEADLKVKGTSETIKRGTLVKNIRLTDDPGLIECNTKQVKGLVLKTEFLKKA